MMVYPGTSFFTVPCLRGVSGLGLTLAHDQLWETGCVKRHKLQNPGDHGALQTRQCSPIIHLDFLTLKIRAFVSQYLHQHIPTSPVIRINIHDDREEHCSPHPSSGAQSPLGSAQSLICLYLPEVHAG